MLPIVHRAQNWKFEDLKPHWGVEIDIRPDSTGFIVVCHDPDQAEGAPYLFNWLKTDINLNGRRPVYALNVKADGMADDLELLLKRFDVIDTSFVFDMSYPEMRRYANTDIAIAGRSSDEEVLLEYLPCPPYGWWDWWNWSNLKRYQDQLCDFLNELDYNGTVVIVSRELHDRDADLEVICQHWDLLKSYKDGIIGVCTDCPQIFEEYVSSW